MLLQLLLLPEIGFFMSLENPRNLSPEIVAFGEALLQTHSREREREREKREKKKEMENILYRLHAVV